LVKDMEHIINTGSVEGVGLAAIQIGVNKSVIIYKDRAGSVRALCNPKIVTHFGTVTSYDESCLSIPGFRANVERFKGIKVKAQMIDGNSVTIKERGFQSIILQHEIEHLCGTLFTDHVSNKEKLANYTAESFEKKVIP